MKKPTSLLCNIYWKKFFWNELKQLVEQVHFAYLQTDQKKLGTSECVVGVS